MWHVAEEFGVSVTQLNRTGGDTLWRLSCVSGRALRRDVASYAGVKSQLTGCLKNADDVA